MFSVSQLTRPKTGWPGQGHVPSEPCGFDVTARRPVGIWPRHLWKTWKAISHVFKEPWSSGGLNLPATVSEKEFSTLPVASRSTHVSCCNPACEAHRKGFSLLPGPASHMRSHPVMLGTSPTMCLEAEIPESLPLGFTGEIPVVPQAGEAYCPAVSWLLRVLTESEGNGCVYHRQLRKHVCRNGI